MNDINFYFDFEAQVKQRPRLGKHGTVYTPASTKLFERTIAMVASQQMFGRTRLLGSIKILISFVFTKPKAAIRPGAKKDLDNLIKSVCDGLNEIAYDDDRQITWIEARKVFGEKSCILVTVSNVSEC